MIEALAIFLPFLLTGLLLPWWQKVCKRLYTTPVDKKGPLGGGWLLAGLVALFMFGVTLVPPAHLPTALTPQILAQFAFISLLAILFGTLWQKIDRTGADLSRFHKILPFLFAGIGAFFLPELHPALGYGPERALYVVVWLVIMRAIILADALDGLACVSAAIVCLGLSVFVKPVAVPALVTAGCCLGFLRFNRPDAILLLGASGRAWLGFVVGGLWLLAATHAAEQAHIFALLVLLVPLLFNNFLSPVPWHARLESLGLLPGKVLAKFVLLQGGYFILALVAFIFPVPGWILIFGLTLFFIYMAYIKWLERSL